MEGNGTDGNSYKTHGNDREQAGMSREGQRTMEKVLENTVHDMVVVLFCCSCHCLSWCGDSVY